jgi:hypothetical protein
MKIARTDPDGRRSAWHEVSRPRTTARAARGRHRLLKTALEQVTSDHAALRWHGTACKRLPTRDGRELLVFWTSSCGLWLGPCARRLGSEVTVDRLSRPVNGETAVFPRQRQHSCASPQSGSDVADFQVALTLKEFNLLDLFASNTKICGPQTSTPTHSTIRAPVTESYIWQRKCP